MKLDNLTTRSAAPLALLIMLSGCSKPTDQEPEDIEVTTAECQRDEIGEPASAAVIEAGAAQTGHVCPVQDEDWYKYTMPAGHQVLNIGLELSAPLSPIAPSYSVWTSDGGDAGQIVAQPGSTQIGAALSDVHCVAPGDLLIKVHDSGDDAQDTRNTYALNISSAPDPDNNEPNETTDAATALTSGQAVTAAIACKGDHDVYSFSLATGNLVRVQLTSEVTGYEPTLEIRNAAGDLLINQTNSSGTVEATNIDRFEILEGAGDYTITVRDDDDAHAAPTVPYSLLVEFVSDKDNNEPNNHPDDATVVSQDPVDCGSSSQTFTFTGTIGAANDQDYFAIPLGPRCDAKDGIMDAKVTLNTSSLSAAEAWELQSKLQIGLALVRPHGPSACDDDTDCNTLQQSCNGANECAGLFETCLPENLCAGASVCLPNNVCGANQVIRRYECNPRLEACQPSSASPPPQVAQFSAPLIEGDVAYLRVFDFQADAAAPDLTYTLEVSLRPEQDPREPSNLFTNELPPGGASVGTHSSFATEIPVHNCVDPVDPMTDPPRDCCDSGTWIEGTLSYENDLDWFRYEHPCPDEDCTLRMHYEVDAGPVDFVVNLYRQNSLWFTAFDNDEQVMQAGKSGTLGGLTQADRCFYAYQGHTSNNTYNYYVVIRDLFELYGDLDLVVPESRDWSGSQRYRICVEKIANECAVPPCQLYDNGCGQPQN